MFSSDFRKEAREKLAGKWGKAVLITLVYLIFSIILNSFEQKTEGVVSSFFSILYAVIMVPIAYGLVASFLKLFNGEEVGTFDFFTEGFNNFGRSWGVAWHIFLKLIIPMIITIISASIASVCFVGGIFMTVGTNTLSLHEVQNVAFLIGFISFVVLIFSTIWLTMKSLYYSLAQYIAIEKTELTTKDAVLESKKLMTGKRAKLFCLQLSFIGWAILAVLAFGIGILWLFPYMQMAVISFYKFAKGNQDVANIENVEEKAEE